METVCGVPVLGTVDESGQLHFTPEGKALLLGNDDDTVTLAVPADKPPVVIMDTHDKLAAGLNELGVRASDTIHSIDGIACPLNVNAAYYVAEARRKLLLAMLDLHSAARCQQGD